MYRSMEKREGIRKVGATIVLCRTSTVTATHTPRALPCQELLLSVGFQSCLPVPWARHTAGDVQEWSNLFVIPRATSTLQKHGSEWKATTLEDNFNLHHYFSPWHLDWFTGSQSIFFLLQWKPKCKVNQDWSTCWCVHGRAEKIDSASTTVHLSLCLSGF